MRYNSPKIEIGPEFKGHGKFKILFFNTNIYEIGIANLGWQVVVKNLLDSCPAISIRLEYADTIERAHVKSLDYNLIALHILFWVLIVAIRKKY